MTATLLAPRFLYDGTRHAPRTGWGVVVEDGLILDVGPVDTLRPCAAPLSALPGTLGPGLVDVHTHLVLSASADPAATLRAERQAGPPRAPSATWRSTSLPA